MPWESHSSWTGFARHTLRAGQFAASFPPANLLHPDSASSAIGKGTKQDSERSLIWSPVLSVTVKYRVLA